MKLALGRGPQLISTGPWTLSVLIFLFIAVTKADAQARRVDLFVEDHRPVAKAIEGLTSAYPVIVTYEDPRYEFAGDVRDATLEVRRDLASFATGKAPRILVPQTRALAVSYDVLPENGEPENWLSALEAIVRAHEVNAGGGRFRVEQIEDAFHIVPTDTRDARGQWVAVSPVLDTIISIPEQELDGFAMLTAICEAVAHASETNVVIGTIPDVLLLNHRGVIEAENERARDVLRRTLRSVNENLTWHLLYGVSSERFALNVRTVAATLPNSPGRVGREVAPRSSPFITPEGRERAQRERAGAGADAN